MFEQFTYFVYMLVFAGGAVLIEWLARGQFLWPRRKIVLEAVIVFVVYGIVADNFALSWSIWAHDPAKILGVWVLGMPLEEIIFCILVAIAISSAVLVFADREDRGFRVLELPRKFFKG